MICARQVGAVAVALMFGVTACSSGSNVQVVVTVAAPAIVHVAPSVSAIARPAKDLAITSDRRATVVTVLVHNGQVVRSGQQLVLVRTVGESGDVTALNNLIQADYAGLSLARSRYGKSSAQANAALAAVVRDRSALARSKADSGRLAAPIGGTVVGLSVRAGQAVDAKTVMMRVIDNRTLRMTAIFAPEYDHFVRAGTSVTVRSKAAPTTAVETRVSSVTPTSSADGDRACEITFDGATAGLTGDDLVTVSTNFIQHAQVAVNNLAVLQADMNPVVFVVQNHRVVQRSVVLGLSDASKTQILSGVRAGDRVVIAGAQTLQSGSRVEVVRSESSS